jgi:hypothetical protein
VVVTVCISARWYCWRATGMMGGCLTMQPLPCRRHATTTQASQPRWTLRCLAAPHVRPNLETIRTVHGKFSKGGRNVLPLCDTRVVLSCNVIVVTTKTSFGIIPRCHWCG